MSTFRLQIFDDGAGEYIFDQSAEASNVGGNESNTFSLSGNARGPFILPSPLPICKPGLMTVAISNINTPTNSGAAAIDANVIIAYIGLVFAIPKKCKDVCYGGVQGQIDRGLERKGVIN